MNADETVRLADGRDIHLVCMGEGSPTVILTAGLGSWSMAWRMVQPTVARTTRACAWDRAGIGFSDASNQTQTVDVTTTDLEAALAAANIDGPWVVVGHSMGSYETLLFADRRRAEVVGMVLVDPSIPDQAAVSRMVAPTGAAIDEADMAEAVAGLRRCAAAIADGSLTTTSPDPEGCLVAQPTFPPALIAALAMADMDPHRHLTRASLTENFPASAAMVVSPARDYGDLPLVVLTAGKPSIPDDAPAEILAERPAFIAAWNGGHDALAALSSRGVNRTIADSGHSIQREQPGAVIAAILEVVEAARSPQ
ncbi:MAG TPA: alpha/beta hydrolase [Brevundimonas sp.]